MKIHPFFPMRYWDEMVSFLSRNYRPDLALCFRRVYSWQFMAGQYGGNACMIAAFDGNRLVGIQGYLPTPVFWGDFDRPVWGAWAANLYVEPVYRNGLGWMLLSKLKEMYPILLGTGISNDGERLVTQMGWTFFHQIHRYLVVLDSDRAMVMAGPETLPDDLRPLQFTAPSADSLPCREFTPTGAGYTPNWSLYPAMAYGTIRSSQYFQWRYREHPVFTYHVWLTGAETRPAVCVYRIEKAFGRCEALVGRIVEFFHPNDAQGKAEGIALIHTVLQQLKTAGCVYADFIGSSQAYQATLLEAGWVPEPPTRQILPVRLCPVEDKLRHQNLEYYHRSGWPSPTLGEMYVTKSDGDEDRAASIPPEQVGV
jgi:hypothetical protein